MPSTERYHARNSLIVSRRARRLLPRIHCEPRSGGQATGFACRRLVRTTVFIESDFPDPICANFLDAAAMRLAAIQRGDLLQLFIQTFISASNSSITPDSTFATRFVLSGETYKFVGMSARKPIFHRVDGNQTHCSPRYRNSEARCRAWSPRP